MAHMFSLGLLALLLTGCTAAPRPAAAPGEAAWPPAFVATAAQAGAGRLLALDPAASALRIYVFRGGHAARLGHNHLLAVPRFEGWLWWPVQDMAQARGALRVPLAELQLDEPAQRAATGGAFAAPLSAEAIAATRANLLGPRGLDAERQPFLHIRLLSLVGEPPRLAARVELSLGQRRHALDVVLRQSGSADQPRLTGALVLRQSELGLTPFSLVGGLLAVQDELVLEFELQAAAAAAASSSG